MVTINVTREMDAGLDQVWNIVSDVDNDPAYWQDLHSVKNVRREGNTVERVATVGFRKSRSQQTVVLDPKKSVKILLTEGPMKGTRVLSLNESSDGKTQVNVVWDVEMSGIPSFMRGAVEKRITKGTEDALNRISKAI